MHTVKFVNEKTGIDNYETRMDKVKKKTKVLFFLKHIATLVVGIKKGGIMARRKKEWLPYCDAIEDNGLMHYEVAAEAKISPYTLSRWLRENPTESRKEAVGEAIKNLVAKRPPKVNL